MLQRILRRFKDGHEAAVLTLRAEGGDALQAAKDNGLPRVATTFPNHLNINNNNNNAVKGYHSDGSDPIALAYDRLTANSVHARKPLTAPPQKTHYRRARKRPRNPYNLSVLPAHNNLKPPKVPKFIHRPVPKHGLSPMVPRLVASRNGTAPARNCDAGIDDSANGKPSFSQWMEVWGKGEEEPKAPPITMADFADPRDWELYRLQNEVTDAERRIEFLEHSIHSMERNITTLTAERELAMEENTSLLNTLRRVRRRLIAVDPKAPFSKDPSETPAFYRWNMWHPQAVAYPADLDALNANLEARRRQREEQRLQREGMANQTQQREDVPPRLTPTHNVPRQRVIRRQANMVFAPRPHVK